DFHGHNGNIGTGTLQVGSDDKDRDSFPRPSRTQGVPPNRVCRLLFSFSFSEKKLVECPCFAGMKSSAQQKPIGLLSFCPAAVVSGTFNLPVLLANLRQRLMRGPMVGIDPQHALKPIERFLFLPNVQAEHPRLVP